MNQPDQEGVQRLSPDLQALAQECARRIADPQLKAALLRLAELGRLTLLSLDGPGTPDLMIKWIMDHCRQLGFGEIAFRLLPDERVAPDGNPAAGAVMSGPIRCCWNFLQPPTP